MWLGLIPDVVLRSPETSVRGQTVAAHEPPAPGTIGSLSGFSPRDLELLGRRWESVCWEGSSPSFRLDEIVEVER